MAIQHRRGTAAEATSANVTLAAGQLGVETDTGRLKVGDGITAWTSLPYSGPAARRLFGTGRYYTYGQGTYGVGTVTVTAGDMHCHPFRVDSTRTFDRIGVRVGTLAASSAVRLGVYADDGTGLPGALQFDAGTIDSTTTGNKEITISQSLTAGWWWLAALAQVGSPLVVGISTGQILEPMSLDGFNPNFAARPGFLRTGVAAGALPNPFGSTTQSSTGVATVFLRAT